jgi:hypothetical protein
MLYENVYTRIAHHDRASVKNGPRAEVYILQERQEYLLKLREFTTHYQGTKSGLGNEMSHYEDEKLS